MPFLWEKEIPGEILRETEGKDKQRGSRRDAGMESAVNWFVAD